MHEMTKGGNVGLAELSEDTGSVLVSLSWSSAEGEEDADVSVLLLGADGKVRGDGDFYFYNNPAAPDGSVQLLGKNPTSNGSEDRISLDLTAMPPDVIRVVLAASRDGEGCFGELDDLRLALADRGGDPVLGFSIHDAGVETAVIFGELYRRGQGWKFRGVGQGYATGLAGLATDFGVHVDETGEGDEPSSEPGAPDAPGPADAPEAPEAMSAAAAPPGLAGAPAPAPGVAEPGAPEPGTVTAPRARAQVPEAHPAGPDPLSDPAQDGTAPARRPRTAKKKITLPATPGKSLAENDSWKVARLFPVPSLKSDHEREVRATSVLLSVMAQVPEFGRRLTAAFGAPAGRMQTFTEVPLPNGEARVRPDGVIRVARAGKLWTALLETKTNGNPLKAEQVQSYVDIASRRGYEAVITLSNDVALEGHPLAGVRTDGRRKNKVALWHLSWAEVAHQAQMLIRHEGVGNWVHAWLLQELLHYLQHDNSGCHGFQNMGPAWVPVRNSIEAETLSPGDPRAVEIVESWERLVRQVSLRLGGELGQKVLPVRRTRRGAAPGSRHAALADRLCEEGRLSAELRIEGTPGVLSLLADLRTGKLRTSVDVPTAAQGYPLTRVKRLVRQLSEAPGDLHVETLLDGGRSGPRGTLERVRPAPGDLLPTDGAQITGFRLSLFKGMGNSRGNAETSFIRSVDKAVEHFHANVVARLPMPGPAPTAGAAPGPETARPGARGNVRGATAGV